MPDLPANRETFCRNPKREVQEVTATWKVRVLRENPRKNEKPPAEVGWMVESC